MISIPCIDVAMTHRNLQDYLRKLDGAGVVYEFIAGVGNISSDPTDLELIVDSIEPGVSVKLHNDGTWTATAKLQVELAAMEPP